MKRLNLQRRAALALTGIAFCLGLGQPAAAQDAFPTKSVVLMVGVAPGGSLDALARLIGNELSKITKQTFVVENVVGAGGLVAFQRLTRSAPDGYTLMFSNQSMVLIPLLNPKSGLDVVKDTTAIASIANVPMVLAVSNKSGIQDLPTMIADMRGGKLKPFLGSGGPGTTAHLAEAMFLQMAGGQGELVQYRGSGPAITDLMAGTIQSVLDQTVTMLPLHKDKRVKAIAVASKERLPQMPDVPTFAEGGLPQFNMQIWNGIVGPKGMPKEVVERLNKLVMQAMATPEYRSRLNELATQIPSAEESSPAGFTKTLERDQKAFAELAKKINLPTN
jgi:tripartite-type tricarboxylate transporter receptor subunit TctC